MGQLYKAVCNECEHTFNIGQGGGFMFHQLRCDQCGQEIPVNFDALGDIHLRYLKGLTIPYSIATQEHDNNVRLNYPGEPLPEKEYNLAVEAHAGCCQCGGQYKFDAPARCPRCKSTRITQDENPFIYYD